MTDFASNFTNALTAGYQGRALRDAADERQRRRALAPDVQAAIGGDAQALGRVAAVDADYAVKLGPILQAMSEKQRAAAKAGAEFTYNAANAVLQTDPANRPTVYRQMLEQGKAMGHNMASLPGEYTPQMDGMLRSYRQMAIPVLEQWKAEQDRPQPMSGGGAAGAIAGIESGGRYDAVGPSATPQGNRAYGKYQVMDFNVGPWTQEILGKAMTPQEFAANPDAQEKVFEAKFGQYTKQFGTPQAAARAWFAGPGGMNNPNAKDVNGTTVAGYEKKFTAAGGGAPAMSGTAPVQQGDGNPALVAPANDPRAAVRGIQLPPGAKIMAIKGVPVVKDGTVMVQMPDGTPDFIPLPQRKEPGQAPAGYQAGPLGPDGRPTLLSITGGPADPAQAGKLAEARRELKAIPTGENDKLSANVTLINRIDKALGAYTGQAGAPEQSGRFAGWLARSGGQGGDLLAQEIDPKGVDARALISDINSQIMLARSGAAVTESEAKRLLALLPSASDRPEVIAQKLRSVRDTYAEITRNQAAQYTEKNGYIPHGGVSGLGEAPKAAEKKPAGPQGAERTKLLRDAKDAIAKGAPRDKVIDRLRSMGVEGEP